MARRARICGLVLAGAIALAGCDQNMTSYSDQEIADLEAMADQAVQHADDCKTAVDSARDAVETAQVEFEDGKFPGRHGRAEHRQRRAEQCRHELQSGVKAWRDQPT
jgi:hypothetical protein